MLPDTGCAGDVTGEVTCSTTWLIGERIRTVAFNGACGCDCDRPFRSYTTIGTTIQDPLGDSLIITLVSLDQSSRSARGNTLMIGTHVAAYRLELRDNGWPVITKDEQDKMIYVPSAEEINAKSQHAQSHGEKMYRALVNAAQTRTLFPITSGNHHIVQDGIAIQPMIPLNPQATQVGWGLNINVHLML
jgi:hypothetical protein